MRVAIVHYWLIGMRGGEKVVESLCELFPEADIFTHVYDPNVISDTIKKHRIVTTFIARMPFGQRRYKSYLPLMPMALEALDLRDYDLVISSESGPAKGIIPAPGALHVCYCHSPMRYLWNMYHDYRKTSGPVTRAVMPMFAHYLRNWDAVSATRVHRFAANSRNVARRLKTYYGRESTVIYPPVSVDEFAPVPLNEVEDYWLMVGELVAYKRPDLAVEAFNKSGKRLVVIGGGEMLSKIKAMAGPTVEVLGPQPFHVLKHHYAHCRALIFPGEEDFGIVPVEAMASGRPVIAYKRGGATESVLEGVSGTFFENQTVPDLLEAVERCEAQPLDVSAIVAQAKTFGRDRFSARMLSFIDESREEMV